MAELSPMMNQYMKIKDEYEDSILFFRLGDFYEMFFDDAKTASRELDLTLTGKDCGLSERAPMCGVPYHSCEAYIARLVERGYKVAVCEQTEDPKSTKKLVSRDVVRIITPGTVIESDMLDEAKNNYLSAVCCKNGDCAVCFADVSTGESYLTAISREDTEKHIISELMRFSPSELIITEKEKNLPALSEFLKTGFQGSVTVRPDKCFEDKFTENLVCKAFGVSSTEELGIPQGSAMQLALGAAVDYTFENSKQDKVCFKRVDIYNESQYMRFDITAAKNLEICETMRSKSKKGSLLWVLDQTGTAMGKRLIRSWLLKPLMSIPEITLRQNAVEELCQNTVMRCEAVEYMNGIRDIERIITRAAYGTASPKDLLNLGATAERFPPLKSLLEGASSQMLRSICSDIDPLTDIAELIKNAIDENAPITVRDGKVIRKGYSAEVDELKKYLSSGTDMLADIENRERERTGIRNLKVKYNKVFGYYIEVTNSFKERVPEDYIRKQTLVNAERYITEELKELEDKVLNAKERIIRLENEIYGEVRATVADAAARFRRTAGAIARLDVVCSFAQVAVDNNYTRPLVNNSGAIKITEGRHPVVEQIVKTPFVSNDTYLDLSDNRCAIITGPNMAGKSTYMRQTALITLMAQIGSFVPARSAEIGVCDAIYTRVGASDDLSLGQSTFMVEMSEVADILKNATKNSLLILDEIGRGTSTYDGMAIARAVLEFVADRKKLGAKALFATHYHELTEMENELNGVKNYNIAAKKRGDDIIFLRRIVRGGADDSYGIEVASLSGIPKAVIERAKQILKKTVNEGTVTYKTVKSESSQLSFDMQQALDISNELKALDVNTLTPIEAMSVLFELSSKAKNI